MFNQNDLQMELFQIYVTFLHKTTMAQMAHFSFPYYFTIPNCEFRIPKFASLSIQVVLPLVFVCEFKILSNVD